MKQEINHNQHQGECSYSSSSYNMMHQHNMMMMSDEMIFGGGRGFINSNNMNMMNMNMNMLSSSDQMMHQQPQPQQQQPWSMPSIQELPFNNHESFIVPPQQQQQASPYASFFNSRRVHPSSSSSMQFAAAYHHHEGATSSFDLQAELSKMTAQEIMEAKALAASKSHSEAERRRRERINNHLSKLRSLLPSTTKTDKASLLAEVIQHVKELKRQTSMIAETSSVPTESDELTVDDASDEDGKLVIKASLCCEDRSDLLPELIKTLKSMKLRTLKADITTLGGRVKNVLFITAEQDYYSSSTANEDHHHQHDHNNSYQYCISSIQEALKAVMEKSNGGVGNEPGSSSASVKRQRTNIISSIS
ncbi:hypothetical protein HN51_030065 [Arachis hypogaea]|uniref:BHLH domain-containing protein n=1 Tax=Arachis hypogaea TaxID=3818 RepID=A0A445BCJ8_ARAHY|nr:transcription factor bHLH30-like [Arachis hypogaea]XP_025621431.1 transcription factor bHLH30-like [Arachis hypogaea]XP_025621432.1 transcription factor bHLH30-like [Arachis hypogaea]XP_025621433.1 transcription factor bHLH30-like [Arachis hypogaea]QHO36224.1 Transcription factor [Arachis hypogaea]RYR36405.1 hypothetical protein Ahy_A09g041361 [Arachis hypogaea]